MISAPDKFLSLLLLIAASFFISDAHAQGIGERGSWIGGGLGMNVYNGDVDFAEQIGNSGTYRLGAHLMLQQKLNRYLGVHGRVFSGKVASDQVGKWKRASFETSLKTAGVGMSLNLGCITFGEKNLMPYLSLGVNFVSFEARGDLKEDASGSKYYHWSTGEIRNMAETATDAKTKSKTLTRDYRYETNMNTLRKYPATATSMALGLGFMFQPAPRVSIGFVTSYDFGRTDYLDGQPGGKLNDGFLYTSLALYYKFAGRDEDEQPHPDEDNAAYLRIPEELRFADRNKDGYISPDEMRAVLYKEMVPPITEEIKNLLVDFFYEQ